MLNATLHSHLSQYRSSIAQDMLTNLYVDNIVTGCESEDNAVLYYNTARSIMKEAQFNLRSWASNSHKLTNLATKDKVDDGNSTVNVLGLQWDTQTDMLSLTLHIQVTYSCYNQLSHKAKSAKGIIQGI